jgi:hypothetical protein
MNFFQRFRFFLIGFIPGCIILFFIVRKNGCTSANELKMLELQYQTLQLGKKAVCKLNCLKLTEALFKTKLRDFEVDYDLSDVHKKPYGFYYLKNMETKTNPFEMVIEDRDTISFINDIRLLSNPSTCNCDTIQ